MNNTPRVRIAKSTQTAFDNPGHGFTGHWRVSDCCQINSFGGFRNQVNSLPLFVNVVDVIEIAMVKLGKLTTEGKDFLFDFR